MRETKHNIPFELKVLSENGEFEGLASPYGNVDHGNDVVEPGAFTKTISERGNKVRLLDSHKIRIGISQVVEVPGGLFTKGKINLEKESGRDAYSDLKFYRDEGQAMGLSIGYEAIKAIPASQSNDGARHLKEVRLWEISITEFPMNENALVTNVKEHRAMDGQKMTFDEALADVQTWAARYQYMEALDKAISTSIRDENLSTDDAVAQIAESVQQFGTQIAELVPKLRALLNSTYGFDFKKFAEIEAKAGRKISAASRSKIEDAIKQLQALLDDGITEDPSTGKSATPPESKEAPPPEAASQSTEPVEDHSKLISQIDQLREVVKWQ